MEDLNLRFHQLSRDLRDKAFKSLPGIILFYDNKVICYKEGESKGYKELDLSLYNMNKIIAHSLILYSAKHERPYRSLSDLCAKLRDKISMVALNKSGDNSDKSMKFDTLDDLDLSGALDEKRKKILDATIEDLMQESSDLFLSELHKAVQDFRTTVFNGIWPAPLLLLVAGPASPRIGHPAMQYFGRLSGNRKELLENPNMKYIAWLHGREEAVKDLKSRGICVHMQEFNTTSQIRTQVDPGRQNKTRFLYYVENPTDLVQTLKIGLSLYVEETVFSKYKSMETDILAKDCHDHLNRSAHLIKYLFK